MLPAVCALSLPLVLMGFIKSKVCKILANNGYKEIFCKHKYNFPIIFFTYNV